MILYINTTSSDLIKIGVKNKNKFIVKKQFYSKRTQAEKLLPGIAKLLKASKFKLSDLQGIAVANSGGSFTSLRVGVAIGNALGYALDIPVTGESGKTKIINRKYHPLNVVIPRYQSEPNITKKKA